MELLTIFEHESCRCDLQSRQISALEQFQQRMGTPILQPVYRAGAWYLRAGQHVGVVRLGAYTIQILPKIYRSPDTVPPAKLAQEATANLLHMLAYAGMVQVNVGEVADLLSGESDWFEILTYLFAHYLRVEWCRGPVRGYRVVEDELPLLKGRWRLPVQIRHPDRAHRFAVSFDEFTTDIPLNRIFRFVVERLAVLTRSTVNGRILEEVRGLLDAVTLLPQVTVADTDAIVLNRLTERYARLLNLARLFLDHRALQISDGDTSLFAFVFDMNRVFEEFVVGFLRRHRTQAMPAALQACTLTTQAQGRPCYLARSEGQHCFRLKPDLMFHQGAMTRLIIDTKYKRLDPHDRTLGIREADFYQMFAYARRYACPQVLLLYPQSSAMQEPVRRRFHLEGDGTQEISAMTLDLRPDLGQRHGRAAIAAEWFDILNQGNAHE